MNDAPLSRAERAALAALGWRLARNSIDTVTFTACDGSTRTTNRAGWRAVLAARIASPGWRRQPADAASAVAQAAAAYRAAQRRYASAQRWRSNEEAQALVMTLAALDTALACWERQQALEEEEAAQCES